MIACFGKNIELVLWLQPATPGVAAEGGGVQGMLIVIVQMLIEQVISTLISQLELANRIVTGGCVECTT